MTPGQIPGARVKVFVLEKRMDNAAYRKSRGTDKPFAGTPEQVQREWNQIRKARAIAAGKPWPPKPKRRRGPWREFRVNDDED